MALYLRMVLSPNGSISALYNKEPNCFTFLGMLNSICVGLRANVSGWRATVGALEAADHDRVQGLEVVSVSATECHYIYCTIQCRYLLELTIFFTITGCFKSGIGTKPKKVDLWGNFDGYVTFYNGELFYFIWYIVIRLSLHQTLNLLMS